uniref:Probable periplasmic serine endoprotease DegP-like n=1 Tax=uncultured Thiotrichaceae bacterium TaxID=298394 RepID=A0A6S6UA47_9GAMM|nr:MAG: HtrA protease/chaperone protein [uncultured Thiotrichaceae bacterium]
MLNKLPVKGFKKRMLPVLAGSALVSALAFQAVVPEVYADELPVLTQLIKQNSDAVVHIKVEAGGAQKTDMQGIFEMPNGQKLPKELQQFFRNMPQAPQQRRSSAMGSGFILSDDGYIVTNTHVIDGAKKVTVTLGDKRELVAEVVGQDTYSDIALLKVDADDLPTVKLGSSDDLEVGQWVFAIGAPFGLDHSATQGIVSALSRSLPDGTYVPFIQTDVAVNPGNSGGPLFDLKGNVVGVNSQIYSRSGGYMGISFSIPINLVKNVTEQLKNGGSVSRGWLGVHIQSLDQELADSFNMEHPTGALVSNVQPSSPADVAGVQAGDIIVGFDQSEVESANHLPLLVGTTPIGKQVGLTVLRNGAEKSLKVKIQKLQDDNEPVKVSSAKNSGALGLSIAPLTDEERKVAKLDKSGVAVRGVEPDSPAANAGLREGDVILALNNSDVSTPAELKSKVVDAPKGKPMAMLIMRDNRKQFVAIKPS